jgi:Cdc6-like AAA superfamily ATPase
MDPRRNPYAPGAGTPPPELAGRDDLIEKSAVALDRIRAGRASRSLILYGLRGVGKTVLLNRIQRDADARGFEAVMMEAPEDKSLPAVLAPHLRALLLRLNVGERAKDKAKRALRALVGFVGAVKVK